MRDERKEIVGEWFSRSERFWILARVAEHEFHFEWCAWHIHALALEMMIKCAILTKDPAAESWRTFESRSLFREGHDVVRLLRRWNLMAGEHAILPESAWCLLSAFCSNEEKMVESPGTFGSMATYCNPEMVGRYSDGVQCWDRHAYAAANIVFFRLRTYVQSYLGTSADAIDQALVGSAGRTMDAEWLRRAARKSNPGIAPELRVHD